MKVQIEEGDRKILEYAAGSSGQHKLSVVHDQVYGSYNMVWSTPDGDEIQWRGRLEDVLRKFETEVIEFENDKSLGDSIVDDARRAGQLEKSPSNKQRLVHAGLEAYQAVIEECQADPQYEGDREELARDLSEIREMLVQPLPI